MATLFTSLALVGFLAAQPSYTGDWYRDDAESDDPKPKIDATISGFVQKASRGRSSASDVDPRYLRRLRNVLDTLVLYADELYVERGRRELVVDDGGEDLRIYYLDGEEHERQLADGTRLETKAVALGGGIDVEMKTEDGAKIFESYSLSSGGEELVLVVRLEDKQLKAPLVIRSVYTRLE